MSINAISKVAKYYVGLNISLFFLRAYCIAIPKNFKGYGPDSWGLTASYSINGYDGHSPTNDLGVISPTAAISSIAYTPQGSMAVMKHLYGG